MRVDALNSVEAEALSDSLDRPFQAAPRLSMTQSAPSK
jgi:hypothetical protein